MSLFTGNPLWQIAQKQRKKQHFWGKVAAILLAIALLGLFDGLIAQMRQGSFELEMLPDQSQFISGPSPLKNPLNSDVITQKTPGNAPLTFILEGFFSGYWFGNGMWRGEVKSGSNAEPGIYKLRIAFKGASSQSAQNWTIRIFKTYADLRANSLSVFRKLLDCNPFIIAAICGSIGILAGISTYFYGRLYATSLAWLGLAEIYAVNKDEQSILCLTPEEIAPHHGNARMVMDCNGVLLGEARTENWQKGKLKLIMLDGVVPEPGALVCLKPPQATQKILSESQTRDSRI